MQSHRISKVTSLKIDFSQAKEAGYQQVFNRSPLLTNFAANWNGIYFVYDYQPAGETPEVIASQHGVVIFAEVPHPIEVERTLDGSFRREQLVQGDMLLVPAHIATRARWNGEGGMIYLGFDYSALIRAVDDVIRSEQIQLLPQFATSDPLIYQIGLAIKGAIVQHGTCSRLYAETLATTLMLHVLQCYSVRRPSWRDTYEGLSRSKFHQVVDYIQAHLDHNLGLSELAIVAQMSTHYFCQQFKQTVGMTPHQYVIRCRVERAKGLLNQGESITRRGTCFANRRGGYQSRICRSKPSEPTL